MRLQPLHLPREDRAEEVFDEGGRLFRNPAAQRAELVGVNQCLFSFGGNRV